MATLSDLAVEIAGDIKGRAPAVHTHAVGDVTGLWDELDAKSDVEPTDLFTSHLDTISEPGDYYQPFGSRATIEQGYPNGVAGGLRVIANPGRNQVQQIFTPFTVTTSGLYWRAGYNGSWSRWWQAIDQEDPRLTDARAPLAHEHSQAEVQGLESDLDAIRADIGTGGSEPVELLAEHLDTVTEPGNYYQSHSSEASLAQGYPGSSAGSLRVTSNASRAQVQQVFTTFGTGLAGRYWRTYYGGVWSQWWKIVVTSDLDGIASGYDVAVGSGFVGTEQEWLTSLQGPQGPEGPAGGTSVTDPQIAGYIASDTETAAALELRYRRGLNAREFGVVGDGVADDTVPFLAALNAVGDGGTLYVDRPIRVTAPLEPNLAGAGRTRIVFTNEGSLFGDHSLNGRATIELIGAQNVEFVDLVLTGAGPGLSESGAGVYGVTVDDSAGVKFKGGDLSKFHREALYFRGVDGVEVRGVNVSDAAYATRMGSIQFITCTDVEVADCTVTRTGWKGISASDCTRIRVRGCAVIHIGGGDGILIGGSTDFQISNNQIHDVEGNGDGIKTTVGSVGGTLTPCTDGIVSGNVIRNVRNDGGGIRVTSTHRTTVVGNRMEDTGTSAIPVAADSTGTVGCTDVQIIGNSIQGAGSHAVYIGDNCNRIIVSGNYIDNTLWGSGILMVAGATNLVVSGNTVTRSASSVPVRVLDPSVTGVVVGNLTPVDGAQLTEPVAVTGSKSDGTALASLLSHLSALGTISDSTTA